jgi:hypothetical protein
MDLTGGNQDIADLLNKYGAIAVATTPLAGTLVARLIFGKSKMATNAIRLGAGWLAAKAFLAPHVDQMQQTLVQLTALIHQNGYN